MQHWSSCPINGLPAFFPRACNCGGFKAGKECGKFEYPADYTLGARLERFLDLQKARWRWLCENCGSPRYRLHQVAMRAGSMLPRLMGGKALRTRLLEARMVAKYWISRLLWPPILRLAPTAALSAAMRQREDVVTAVFVGPYEEETVTARGPCVVLINID